MKKIYNFVNSHTFNTCIYILIILNIAAIILETEPGLKVYEKYFYIFELFSVIIYSIEYILRLISCVEDPQFKKIYFGRIKYALTPFAIIDLIAIVPFYLPMIFPFDLRIIRTFRLLRIFRILKIGRYIHVYEMFKKVARQKKEELVVIVVTIGIFIIICSSLLFYVEHDAQPEVFPSILRTMRYCLLTLTSVGDADATPITHLGKILEVIIAICGVGFIAAPAAILTSGIIEEIGSGKKRK